MRTTTRVAVAGGAAMGAIGAAAGRRRRRRAAQVQRPARTGFMLAMHGAFRRDLAALRDAAARHADGAQPDGVREGWELLRHQLEVHHVAEDRDLWPVLCDRLTSEADLAEVAAMVVEHARIPAALDAVDAAVRTGRPARGAVDELASLVEAHLDHEERAVLPLIQRHLTDAEWHDWLETERRAQPPRDRVRFLAWVLDRAAPEHADAVLEEIPRPGRFVYRHAIAPRHEARHLWSDDDGRAHAVRPRHRPVSPG
jgi:hemerythrin-like domain-containing protein